MTRSVICIYINSNFHLLLLSLFFTYFHQKMDWFWPFKDWYIYRKKVFWFSKLIIFSLPEEISTLDCLQYDLVSCNSFNEENILSNFSLDWDLVWRVLSLCVFMNSMRLVIPLHFVSWKKTSNDAVTPQCQSQFTPKMKANAEPPLLSSFCELTLVLWCQRIVWSLFSWNKM